MTKTPMLPIVQTPEITIYQGNAAAWPGTESVDVVFTNPYGFLPTSLSHSAMVIHQWKHRKSHAERWCGTKLTHVISAWNRGREMFWSAHMKPMTVDLTEFYPEPEGWYPEALVLKLLPVIAQPGQTVWDGFMGRGTIAKVCRDLGVHYVGVEQLPKHIDLARKYLGI